MEVTVLRAKIHRARVTGVHLHYEGSITIGEDLLEVSGILPYEQVHVVNITTGARFVTYAIPGRPGEIAVNGGAARLALPGDHVIVMAFATMSHDRAREFRPRVVLVDEDNRALAPTAGGR